MVDRMSRKGKIRDAGARQDRLDGADVGTPQKPVDANVDGCRAELRHAAGVSLTTSM